MMHTATRSTRKFLTTFDLPLLVFLISAAAGVWMAYDQTAAWGKFWLILIGVAIYGGLSRIPEIVHIGKRRVFVFEWILGTLPALIALYFFLTNDWTAHLGKVPRLDPAMRWLASWLPNLSALRIHPNVFGGVLAVLLPLQIAALFQNQTHQRILLRVALVGLTASGLIMSESRGAWLAVAFVVTAWSARRLIHRAMPPWQARVVWRISLMITLIATISVLFWTPLHERVLQLRSDRLEVWRNSFDLASDYPLTGVGLGGFTMPYSSYVLLVHVPHTVHAHHLFLDIWLEQGLLGLLAFAGMVLNAVWPNELTWRWRTAAWVSLGVILLHGLMDDAFYGYGGSAIPLLFVPFAMLTRPATYERLGPHQQRSSRLQPAYALWGMAALILTIGILSPGGRSAAEANLGASAQTRIELARYSNEQWGLQDVLRRSPKIDLTPAIAYYRAALALDPTNATANRRIGQIELALGQYETACRHLERAYKTAPGQRATRQMLGECYALDGKSDQAVALWRSIDIAPGQLDIRVAWYTYLDEQEHATKVAQAAAALKREQ